MALRPAGRTLSSLTGIVVLVAVLWLLLNFVYAPSCGRFSLLRAGMVTAGPSGFGELS